MIGSLFGGFICDRCASWEFSLINSRRIPLILGLFGTALFVLPVAFTHTTWIALASISAAVFCSNLTSTSAWTLVTAVAPENYVASIGSMQNFGGYLGAAVAPIVTGLIVQSGGSFAPAFIVGSAISALAALCYIVLVRQPIAQGDVDR